jgi:hypothetical protein
MPPDDYLSRVGGIGAILGVIVLVAATMLHPMNAHPSDAEAAFAEYALDRYWVATHLGQLVGAVLIASGFVSLSWKLRAGRAGAWAFLAGFAAVASMSLAAALQAVDGVALKFMVDRWSSAAPEARAAVFEAAFGVRQIEIGLASLMEAFFGLTVILYGVAIVFSSTAPRWLGIFAVLGGAAMLTSSVVQAHTGFTDIATGMTMPSTLLVLLWCICVGVFLLRSAGSVDHAARQRG